MFVLLQCMETMDLERSVFRSISINRKEHQQTGDEKAENNSSFTGLSHAVSF